MKKKIAEHINIAQVNKFNLLPTNAVGLKEAIFLIWHNGDLFSTSLVKTGFYCIILGIKGRRKVVANGHEFIIKAHTISIIPANSLVEVYSAEEDFEAQVFLFDPAILKNTWMKSTVLDDLMFINPDYPPTFPLNIAKTEDFKYKLQKIKQEMTENAAFGVDMIRLYLLQLLYDYNRICEICLLNSDSTINRKFQIMHQFRQLVDKEFKTLKTVAAFADRLFISPKYLSECVVDQLGYPASKLIHNRILQEAVFLLKYTSNSIKEIAEELSFDTATHFSRFFSQHTGVRPLKYRAENSG